MDRIEDLFVLVREMRAEMTAQIGGLRAEMTSQMTGQIGSLRSDMNRRFEILDAKVDQNFRWVVGIQLTTMAAVIAALVGAYYR